MILRKLIYASLSLFIVVTLTFILMKSIPGDPFQQEQGLPQEIYDRLCTYYGLNDPWHIQYTRYIKQISSLDFGHSLVYHEKAVAQIIYKSFPNSAILGLEALVLAVPIGIGLGLMMAVRKYTKWNALIQISIMIGISVPSFILATLFQYVFAFKLQWLPLACWGSFAHTVLPALSLAVLPMAFIARMTRANMNEELKQLYILAIRAKGMPENVIIYRHALRNIMIPLLTYLGPVTANILTGSFIIEKIFSVPGLGFWFVTSVLTRDYPLILGITIFYCALLLVITFIVDIVCIALDPRLRRYKG